MPTISRCPLCGKKLQVPSKKVGEQIECPECRSTFLLPVRAELVTASPNQVNPNTPTEVGALPYWLGAFAAMMIVDCGMGLLSELNRPQLPSSMYVQIGMSPPEVNVTDLLRQAFGLTAGVAALALSLAIWMRWNSWFIGLIAVVAFSAVAMLFHAADFYIFHAAAELAIIIYGTLKLSRLGKPRAI